MMTPETAHDACAQPSRERVRLFLTESEAAKAGLLDRWKAARKRKLARESRKVTISTQFQRTLDQLEAIAQSNHWSHRKLAAKIGLPESTLRKLKRERLTYYLPRLESAAARLV